MHGEIYPRWAAQLPPKLLTETAGLVEDQNDARVSNPVLLTRLEPRIFYPLFCMFVVRWYCRCSSGLLIKPIRRNLSLI
jgi:hypothetical protein